MVVARPIRWGNPFPLNGDNREEVVRAFRVHAEEKLRAAYSWKTGYCRGGSDGRAMAVSTCSKCGGHAFEVVLFTPLVRATS